MNTFTFTDIELDRLREALICAHDTSTHKGTRNAYRTLLRSMDEMNEDAIMERINNARDAITDYNNQIERKEKEIRHLEIQRKAKIKEFSFLFFR